MRVNPIILFSFIWIIVIALYSTHLSYVLGELQAITIWYILSVLVVMFLGASLLLSKGKTYHKKWPGVLPGVPKNRRKRLKLLFLFWLLATIFEIGYMGSLPILGLLGIGDAYYAKWGIPSYHGLLNAIIMVLSNYLFVMYIITGKRKYLYYFIFTLMWPVILLTRQMLMSMIIQSLFIYLSVRSVRLKSSIKTLMMSFLIITMFGVIGDNRTEGGAKAFMSLAQPTDNYPELLPSGFLWAYVYLTTPLSNLNNNLSEVDVLTFEPIYMINPLLPSFIRNEIVGDRLEKFTLTESNFNVSTFFPSYLKSFGLYGSLVYFFLIGIVMQLIYKKSKISQDYSWMFLNTIILHNVFFSVFVDFFMSLVFIFQFLLHYLISFRITLRT